MLNVKDINVLNIVKQSLNKKIMDNDTRLNTICKLTQKGIEGWKDRQKMIDVFHAIDMVARGTDKFLTNEHNSKRIDDLLN